MWLLNLFTSFGTVTNSVSFEHGVFRRLLLFGMVKFIAERNPCTKSKKMKRMFLTVEITSRLTDSGLPLADLKLENQIQ
jgi:hypothetical protein